MKIKYLVKEARQEPVRGLPQSGEQQSAVLGDLALRVVTPMKRWRTPVPHGKRRLVHGFLEILQVGLVCGAVALLAACSHRQAVHWDTQDISGLLPDMRFTLIDEQGKTVHARQYLGDINLLYFGYTHCPDTCPLTLSTVEQAFREIGRTKVPVRMLFVSVDPARDTPKIIDHYVHAFGQGIVGLTGTQEELHTVTKRYRVAYHYEKPDSDGNYAVAHSMAIFVFDAKGHARLMMNYTRGMKPIAHDLRLLASQG